MLGVLGTLDAVGDVGAVLGGAPRDVRGARGARDGGVEPLVAVADGRVAAARVEALGGRECSLFLAFLIFAADARPVQPLQATAGGRPWHPALLSARTPSFRGWAAG